MSGDIETGRSMLEIAELDQLQRELSGFDPEAYFDALRTAEEILLVFSCCDARVGGKTVYPGGVIVDWVPNIGGVLPQKEELQAILQTYIDEKIDLKKVTLVACAHGTSEEVKDRANAAHTPGCGARGVAQAVSSGQKPLDIAHHHDVAPLVVDIAASRGGVFTMADAVAHDRNKLGKMLKEFDLSVKIAGGYFDNNAQVLHLDGVEGLDAVRTHDKEWPHNYQDPKRFVVSLGRAMAIASIETQNEQAIDFPGFSFDAEACFTSKMIAENREQTTRIVLEALAQIDYALANALHNFHQEGANFAHPEMFLVRADGLEEYNFFLEVIRSQDETAQKVREHLLQLSGKGVGLYAQILNGEGGKEVRKISLS